jgi:predicted regulator of Ras-like GTPase activity (Roadblock/LC7/MglB family)
MMPVLMTLLEDNAKKVDKIFKDLFKEYKDLDLSICAVVLTLNGVPVFSFQKKNTKTEHTIVSALAAGAMQTGDFVGKKMGYEVEKVMEIIIMGENGHTIFTRMRGSMGQLSEEFVIIAAGNNNTQVGSALRFSQDLGREIIAKIYS